MSKSRLLSILRRQDFWRPMVAELDAARIEDWRVVPPTGHGHPILTYEVKGRTVRIPLPTTPSTCRAARYVPAEIRRSLRGVTRGCVMAVAGEQRSAR